MKIKNPLTEPWYLKYSFFILIVFVLTLYIKTIGLSYSRLDDDFYILTQQASNEKWSSLLDVFNEGVGGKRDILYRPVFRTTFVFESHLLALFHPVDFARAAIKLAHFDNILLHIIQVLLFFQLLIYLSFHRLNALLASLLFAAHPIMTMAVAWVPGRNEMLLSVFMLVYLIGFIKYVDKPNWKWLLVQVIGFMLALFSKENAVCIPLAAMAYLFFFKRKTISKKTWLFSFLIWMPSIFLWYVIRNQAIEEGYIYGSFGEMISLFFQRAPAIVQYTGKIFFPLNLSVYPYIKDTSFIPGILAIGGLVWVAFTNKQRNASLIGFGMLWYVLFILPAFVVPKNLTNAMFEHRMYVPYTGMVFIVAGAFQNWKVFGDSMRKGFGISLLVICSMISFRYFNVFADEFSFFKNAVENNPHSSQASRMYAMQLNTAGKPEQAIGYFEKALALDSNELFANYYLADLLYMNENDLDKAAYHLDREIKLNPFFLETYGKRVYVAYQHRDFQTIKKLMQNVLKMYPNNEISSLNLLISYMELGEKENAHTHLDKMLKAGVAVDTSLIRKVKNM